MDDVDRMDEMDEMDEVDEVDEVDILFWRTPNRDCAIGVAEDRKAALRPGHSRQSGGCRGKPEHRQSRVAHGIRQAC